MKINHHQDMGGWFEIKTCVTNRCFGTFSFSVYQTILVENEWITKRHGLKIAEGWFGLKHDWILAGMDILVHLLKVIKVKKTCQKIDILVRVLNGFTKKSKTQKVD